MYHEAYVKSEAMCISLIAMSRAHSLPLNTHCNLSPAVRVRVRVRACVCFCLLCIALGLPPLCVRTAIEFGGI